METENNKDYWCRNCKFRFVPTYWIGGGYSYVTPRCPNCGSNATEEYTNQQESTYRITDKGKVEE